MIHSTYLKFVEQHKGFKLILIYLVNKNVTIEPITLKNCDKKKGLLPILRNQV